MTKRKIIQKEEKFHITVSNLVQRMQTLGWQVPLKVEFNFLKRKGSRNKWMRERICKQTLSRQMIRHLGRHLGCSQEKTQNAETPLYNVGEDELEGGGG